MRAGAVEKDTLLGLLQLAQGIVEKRSLNPILSAVVLTASGGELEIQATNMEESIRARGPGEFQGDFQVAIPLSRLGDFVKELSPGPISLEVLGEGNLFKVAQGRTWAHLPLLPVQEFPTLPTRPDATLPMDRGSLLKALSRTFFSIATDSISTALKGMLMKWEDGKIVFVSTDGHRLSLVEMAHEGPNQGGLEVIIPRKGIQEIRKLLERSSDEEVRVGVVQNHFYSSTGEGEIFVRLLDAKYPSYQKVIPQDFTHRVVVARGEFAKAVRRSSLFSSDRIRGVKLEAREGSVVISSLSGGDEPFSGAAAEELEPLGFSGGEVRLGLNARYVLELVAVLEGEEVVMEAGDPLWPVKFTSPQMPDYLHIVMPLQLEEVEA